MNACFRYTFRGLKHLDTLNIENSDLATIRTNAFSGKHRLIYGIDTVYNIKMKCFAKQHRLLT